MVRLKGGDPLIFGRAGEEIDACRAADIAVEIVPGITAAQGAAAKLGIPLTDRGHARRLQYVTGHARNGALPDDIDWQSLADPSATTAVYMPAKTLAALVARALAEGLDAATPALAISRATRPDQQSIAAPIADLPARLQEAALPGPRAGDDRRRVRCQPSLKPCPRKLSARCSAAAPRSGSARRRLPAAAAATVARAPATPRRRGRAGSSRTSAARAHDARRPGGRR